MNQEDSGTIMLAIATVSLVSLVGCFALAVHPELFAQSRPVPTQTSTEQESTPASDETRDWKTYRNDRYGFIMKYPAGWIFYETPSDTPYAESYVVASFEFPTRKGNRAFFVIYRSLSTDETIDSYKAANERGTYREIRIAGEKGLERADAGCDSEFGEESCDAFFDFHSNRLFRKGVDFTLSIELKDQEVHSDRDFDAYPLFKDEVDQVRRVLSTLNLNPA
jgi:hypothetical protein